MDYFDTLPDEVAHLIFLSVSDCKSLVRCMLVSKAFREKAVRVTSLSILCLDKLASYEEKLNRVYAMIRPFKHLRSLVARLGLPKRDPPTWARCMRYAEIGASVEKFVFMAAKSGDFSDLDSSLMGLVEGPCASIKLETEVEEAISSGDRESFESLRSNTDDNGYDSSNVRSRIDPLMRDVRRDVRQDCLSTSDSVHSLERLSLRNNSKTIEISEGSSLRYRDSELSGISSLCHDHDAKHNNESSIRCRNPDHSLQKSSDPNHSLAKSDALFFRDRKGLSSFCLRRVITPSSDVLKRMLPVIHFAIVQGLNELRDAIPPFIAQFPDLKSFLLVDITESITVFLREHQIEEIRALYGDELTVANNFLSNQADDIKELPPNPPRCDLNDASSIEPNDIISICKPKDEIGKDLNIGTDLYSNEIPTIPLVSNALPKNIGIFKGKEKSLEYHDSFVFKEGCSSRPNYSLNKLEDSSNEGLFLNDLAHEEPLSSPRLGFSNKIWSANIKQTKASTRRTTYLGSYLSRGLGLNEQDDLVLGAERSNKQSNEDDGKCFLVNCSENYALHSLDDKPMRDIGTYIKGRNKNRMETSCEFGPQYTENESRNDEFLSKGVRVGDRCEESQALRIKTILQRPYDNRMWRRAWRERVRRLKESSRRLPSCRDHYSEVRRERSRRNSLQKRLKAAEKDPHSFDYTFWRAEHISSYNYAMSDVSICVVTNAAKPLGDADKEVLTHSSIAGPLLVAIVCHVNKEYTCHNL